MAVIVGDSTVSQGVGVIVGVIVPSSNCVLERELRSFLGDGANILGARVGSGQHLDDGLLLRMAEEAVREAAKLSLASPDVIVYGCTSGAFFGGPMFAEELGIRLQNAAGGIPVVNAASAAADSLQSLGARTIGLATPYSARMHQLCIDFYSEMGFDILADACLGLDTNEAIHQVSDTALNELVRDISSRKPDAVFVSCTGLPTAERLRALTEAVNRPVVSSNSALADRVAQLIAGD